ncbi:ATP-binding protein [Tunicatimonas pelagia]|uniref:ATP-binding protein n=1 Tax=Tunicatimonas pelagia TaxID=931531 RepID=UPI00266630BE|nr:ATP-binding protein [Tunicatimonas pelagia]WKN42459.1 ATP-binding protein [Tunicatimonas pelagia]
MNYSYKVSCCKDELQGVRDFVRETLRNYTISDVEMHQLVLAVDEICSNLMIHSHQCNSRHSIELKIKIGEDRGITFEIHDSGKKGFNFDQYKEPCIKQIIKDRRKGGVGLLLVRRIMDHIDHDFHPKSKRNIYRLYKELAVQPTHRA